MSIEITQLSLTMHSPLGLDKERWYLLSLLCILKWDWTKKDGIHRDYSIVTPDAFSAGMGQRKMVSILYRDCSNVTPDAFITGIGQRKMVSIEITQL